MSDSPPLTSAPLDLQRVTHVLGGACREVGLRSHPFLVGWYNASVSHAAFHLPYPEDTVAFLLLSTPSMFESLFMPYITSPSYSPCQLDPLDQCLKHFFSELAASFPSAESEVIHDFEVDPGSRRPRVLVQTAGHVAGAARYYQRDDVNPDPWPKTKRIYGVSVHPTYGGWFAFRGVFIFKQLRVPDLPREAPADCVPDQTMRIDLLSKYNFSWKDWSFRDVVTGGVQERYSEQQKQYFSAEPSQRHALIQNVMAKCGSNEGEKEPRTEYSVN